MHISSGFSGHKVNSCYKLFSLLVITSFSLSYTLLEPPISQLPSLPLAKPTNTPVLIDPN